MLRQSASGLLIIERNRAAPITKTNAYCLVLLICDRMFTNQAGLVVKQVPEHWERATSNGSVIRCHTYLEATEAANLLQSGIDMGQWKAIRIEAYDPQRDDLPYHDWIRGMRGQRLSALGLTEDDLPETHDPSLAKISDAEWLRRGPR